MYRVELDMCVGGDPLKAWHGTTSTHEFEDTEHVPDDVWEAKAFDFGDDLEAAKAWIRSLHSVDEAGNVVQSNVTTHVKLFADAELIYDEDAGFDHLDDAAPGEPMPHTIDAGGPVVEAQPEPATLAVPPPSDVATEVAPAEVPAPEVDE